MTTLLNAFCPPQPVSLPPRWRPLALPRRRTRGTRLLAEDATDGKTVIVEVPHEPGAAERQAAVLARLGNAAVPPLRHHGNGLLVIERLEGQTLHAMLLRAGGRLPADVLRPLLATIAAAVQTVHAAGVLHRDLKPSNILLRPDGSAVLLDFEAAAAIGAAATDAATLLTPGYAAPEQYLRDGPEGPWTDVYALAAVGWQALTGTLPPVPSAHSAGGGASDAEPAGGASALRAVLRRALATDPRDRPADANAFRRAVLSAEGDRSLPGGGGESPPDDEPPTIRIERQPGAAHPPPRAPGATLPRRPRRRRTGRLLLLLALLAAAAVAATSLARPWYERHVKRDWLVDAAGNGDATAITDALARAGDGAVLRIEPGTYAESLAVGRPVTLVASNPDSPPVIAPAAGPCLAARGDGIVVQRLALRAPPPAEGIAPEACVIVSGGAPRLDGNIIAGDGAPAVLLRDGTTAVLAGNTIRSTAAGVVVTAGARPGIEGNTFAEITGPALLVRGGAAPVVERNAFQASGAVVFGEGAAGSFRANTLHDSRATAIEIAGSADPEITGNGIERPAQSGVYVYGGGRGQVRDNRIEASKLSGIVVDSGAPVLTGNTIADAGEHGILVVNASGGRIEGNTIRNSRRNGIVVGAEASIDLGGNTLQGNGAPQVLDLRRR
ncbi:MAG TPA: right-handed parallel beta-helix repeat-containing protein [Rhodospirillales bacterium]|nr:right-handed parallel beta-helix repeat-containing protein [Rhodospirillales bacterium]